MGGELGAIGDGGGWGVNIGKWAVMGGGQGTAAGFAGGRGDIESIVINSAISSTIAVGLNAAYRVVVNYDAVWSPGEQAVSKLSRNSMPVEGMDNVGYVTRAPGSCPTCEGAPLMRALGRIPGINATAGFHDAMLVRMELGGVSPTVIDAIN